MSASLVGSEMCIRDSPHPARGGVRLSMPSGPDGPLRGSDSAKLVGLYDSVSYTHLTLPTICSV
eukprot:3621078-Alexandrium_andersonii.AAC.1